jgi:hypothetical protein
MKCSFWNSVLFCAQTAMRDMQLFSWNHGPSDKEP